MATPLFDFLHPDDRPSLKSEYVKLSSGEPTTYLENRCRCRDGSYRWVGWTYFPVPEQGIAYGVGRDVTRRKQLEEKLTARAAELEQANHLKDEFLATLSHELRTPLTSVLGWSRLLRSKKLNDPRQEERAVEIIERNAEAQLRMIEDLLDVSRIVTGKLHLDRRPVAPASIVESAINSLRPAAAAKGVQLNSFIDPSIGTITGDAGRLQQIVTNLLSNSIKFTPEAGRIDLHLERVDAGARLTVRDTGVGITPEALPFIFEGFRQADPTATRAHGGLGLGLAIVRHLVEQHGGTVSAESPGAEQGATFTVELPIAPTS